MFSRQVDIWAKSGPKRYQKVSNSDKKNEKTVKNSKKSTTLSIYFAIIMSLDPIGASARADSVLENRQNRAKLNRTAKGDIH
jgi:hypothetical protein